MKLIRRLLYGIAALVVLAALLAVAGGAVNWNREAPYELVQQWGSKGAAEGRFNDPTGIAVSGSEVFVADARNSRIQVFDKQGNFRRAFGEQHLGRPMNLAIADGYLYVPDYFQDVVHVFTLAGDYRRAVRAADGFNSPGGVVQRADGSLLVADTYAQRIVQVGADGEVRQNWHGRGIGDGEFSYPTDIALRADQGFYVADGYNDRVQQFDAAGQVVRKWGGPFGLNIFGPFRGWFATVTSIATGPDGSVFVSDFYNDRVQKFSAEGDFLTSFGTPPTGPGHSEIAVAVDAGGSVWTTNFAANRVEQWRPPASR